MKKNYTVSRRYLIVAASLALLTPVTIAHAQWTALGSSTGISAGAGSYHSIACDTNGHIYVAYHDSTVAKGSLQKYNGSSWSYVGGTAGITDSSAAYSCLAVNRSTNQLFYSYQDGPFQSPAAGKLAVRQYGSGNTPVNSWQTISAGMSYFNATKIGPSGQPYVLYRDLSANGLAAKRYNGSSWVTLGAQVTFQPSTILYYPSMAISNDSVFVAAVSALGSIYVLKAPVMAAAGTAWDAVGNTGWAGPSGSIFQHHLDMTMDAANNLYLAYVSPGVQGNRLSVKKYQNGQWSTLGVDNFSSGTAAYVSIAVTPSGTPYVAFSDGSFISRTTVMKYDGTQWVIVGTAGISTGAAIHNKLTLDPAGNPVVTFADAGQGNRTVVMKYTPPVDSIDVRTQNNIPAVVTANAGTLQMQAVVFPSAASQNVNWSIVPVTGAAVISPSGLVMAQGNGTVYAKAISVTDASKSDSLLITISNQLGIATIDAERFLSVYPSPFRDRVTVALKEAASAAVHTAVVSDPTGKVLHREDFYGRKVQLDLGTLPAGMYFLAVSGAEGVAVVKIIRN